MRAVAGVVVLSTLLVAASARAEDSSVDAPTRAKLHFRLGAAHYEAGNFQQAVVEYQASYDALPMPELLFNLAQAHRMLGDRSVAVDLYTRYLKARPHGGASDEAHRHLAALTVELELERKAQAAERDRAAQQAQAAAAAEAAQRAAAAATEKPPETAVAAPSAQLQLAPQPPPHSRRRWWIVGGAVAAVVVVGLAVGLGVAFGTRSPSDPTPTIGMARGN